MESFRRFQRFKKLGQGLRKSLPIITPWFLVPIGFGIFAAFLRGCAENSLNDVLLFVVLPVAGWIIFSRYCATVFFGPTTAPSLVAALITTMGGTYFFNVFPAMNQLYNATFVVLGVTLVFMFWRMVKSDPGRLIPDISLETIPRYQNRSYNDKLQLAAPRTAQNTDSVRLLASSTAFMEM